MSLNSRGQEIVEKTMTLFKRFFFIYKNSAVILQGENKPHGHLKIKFKSIFIILLHIQCVQHHSHGSVKDYAKRSQRSSIIDSQS